MPLTPVLGDQLEVPGARERFIRFLREIRPESHLRDITGFRTAGQEGFIEIQAAVAQNVALGPFQDRDAF